MRRRPSRRQDEAFDSRAARCRGRRPHRKNGAAPECRATPSSAGAGIRAHRKGRICPRSRCVGGQVRHRSVEGTGARFRQWKRRGAHIETDGEWRLGCAGATTAPMGNTSMDGRTAYGGRRRGACGNPARRPLGRRACQAAARSVSILRGPWMSAWRTPSTIKSTSAAVVAKCGVKRNELAPP